VSAIAPLKAQIYKMMVQRTLKHLHDEPFVVDRSASAQNFIHHTLMEGKNGPLKKIMYCLCYRALCRYGYGEDRRHYQKMQWIIYTILRAADHAASGEEAFDYEEFFRTYDIDEVDISYFVRVASSHLSLVFQKICMEKIDGLDVSRAEQVNWAKKDMRRERLASYKTSYLNSTSMPFEPLSRSGVHLLHRRI